MRTFCKHGLFDLLIIALISFGASPQQDRFSGQAILLASFFFIGAMRLMQFRSARQEFERTSLWPVSTERSGRRRLAGMLESVAVTALLSTHVTFAVMGGLLLGANAMPYHALFALTGGAVSAVGLYRIYNSCVYHDTLAWLTLLFMLLVGLTIFELHVSAFRVLGPLIFALLLWKVPSIVPTWPWELSKPQTSAKSDSEPSPS